VVHRIRRRKRESRQMWAPPGSAEPAAIGRLPRGLRSGTAAFNYAGRPATTDVWGRPVALSVVSNSTLPVVSDVGL